MALHGVEDAPGRTGGRQPLRKRIEFADFVFAFDRRSGVAAHPRGEVARGQPDDEKEQDAEKARAILRIVRVERAVGDQAQRDDTAHRRH
jgi:hypothetical protein